MEIRAFGSTGLSVSAVGLGAGSIGEAETAHAEVARLVDAALDAGVTFFDTARSYGLSEERLGTLLAGRRAKVVLSTKLGYGVPGVPDWTGPCVSAGVDAALLRLRTDFLDVVFLHSCDLGVLERGEVVEALERVVSAGKVRVAGYSGEGDALAWAVSSGRFGAIQCSVSVLDQGSLLEILPRARAAGLGVVAKRALGNAPWRFAARPEAADVATYWDRFAALALDREGDAWEALFARFAAYSDGVSTMLVGTRRAAHLVEAIAAVARGRLPDARISRLRARFAEVGKGWPGQI